MPEHQTLPPPYARHGDRIPDCRSLGNAIAEAEEYLERAQRWVREAQAAEARAEALVTELRKNVDALLAAWNEASKLAGSTPSGSDAYNAVVKHRDEAFAAYKQADVGLAAAQDDALARTRDRQRMEREVALTQAWLGKLRAALAACPPPEPATVPPDDGHGHHGFDAPLGDPLPEPDCTTLEVALAEELRKLEALEAKIAKLPEESAKARERLAAAEKALREAEARYAQAQQAVAAVPQTHDAYWDHLNADGSPAIQYRPNRDYAAAVQARTQAQAAVTAAKGAVTKARDEVAGFSAKATELARARERAIAKIREYELLLEACRRGETIVIDDEETDEDRRTKVLLGLGAIGVAALTMVGIYLVGRDVDPTPLARQPQATTTTTTVEPLRDEPAVDDPIVVVKPERAGEVVVSLPPEPGAPSESPVVDADRPPAPTTTTTAPRRVDPPPPPPPASTTPPPVSSTPPATAPQPQPQPQPEPPVTSDPPAAEEPRQETPPPVPEMVPVPERAERPPMEQPTVELETTVGPPVIVFG